MYTTKKIKVFIAIILLQLSEVNGLLGIAKVWCEATDPTYVYYQHCRLKTVNRFDKEWSVNMTILKEKFERVWLHAELLQKNSAQRYNPLFLNVTIDCCTYLRNRNKVKIISLIHDLLLPYTNLNHTCPFSGDIIIEKFVFKQELFQLPLFNGEYLLKTEWIVDKAIRFKTYVWFGFEGNINYKITTKKAKKVKKS